MVRRENLRRLILVGKERPRGTSAPDFSCLSRIDVRNTTPIKCARCGEDIPKGREQYKQIYGESILMPCGPCIAELKQQMKDYPKEHEPRSKRVLKVRAHAH
jgi:hypothetical protein